MEISCGKPSTPRLNVCIYLSGLLLSSLLSELMSSKMISQFFVHDNLSRSEEAAGCVAMGTVVSLSLMAGKQEAMVVGVAGVILGGVVCVCVCVCGERGGGDVSITALSSSNLTDKGHTSEHAQ